MGNDLPRIPGGGTYDERALDREKLRAQGKMDLRVLVARLTSGELAADEEVMEVLERSMRDAENRLAASSMPGADVVTAFGAKTDREALEAAKVFLAKQEERKKNP